MLIGYARVSTQDQNADSQIAALTKAGCERIFTDIASGASAKRPELQRVLTDVLRPGDTLVIWKLDRLGRNLQDLIALVARLDQLKAGIRSLTDPIDTTSAQGRVTFQIFAAIAEFERALMLERTMNGLEAARAQGRRGGRPAKPLQRDLGTIRQLIESRSITLDEVAKLEDVSRSTLQRRLRKAPPADATDTAPLKPAKRRRRNPT
jgi:DNA invertase Pin-like site-specific DNA recombinase